MSEKDNKDPSTTSLAYDVMKPRWDLIDTVLGGTEAMRNAGQDYLPKHEEETMKGYNARLSSAILLNMTEKTLQTLSSKPFSEGVQYGEDIPDEIVENVLSDVDSLGNNLEVFCKQWFKEGLAKGFCHVLVDFPRVDPMPDGQPRTLDDDRRERIRPYWVLVKPECVIYARAKMVDGQEVLDHVRILETVVEQDGFAEKVVSQIRVLEVGKCSIYRKVAKTKKWALIEDGEWETGLDFIPLVTFYATREGLCLSKPPLLDLAYLNIAHWQTTADQRHALKVSSFPILACSGATAEDSDPITIGPNKILYNPDPSGRFYYVEHQGIAIKAGRDELESLEDKMSGYGAEFLRKKSGGQTATARALDSAESLSDLAGMTMVFEDAIATALWYTARWMQLPNDEGGRVELDKDYSNDRVELNTDTLNKARDRRDISREAYLNALKRERVLPEDFNIEDDLEKLNNEVSVLFDLDPLAGDQNEDTLE